MAGNSKKAEEIIRKLRELNRQPMTVEPAVVKNVDEANLTCTVVLLNDTEIPDVRLKAAIDETPGSTTKDGLVQIPVVDSTVLVAMIGNDTSTRFVMAFSEVDKVMFYGGSNEGLIKINELVEKLNDMVSKFNSHTHTGVTTGGGTSGTIAPPQQMDTVENSDFENNKVLH